jgi:hypothetical protein
MRDFLREALTIDEIYDNLVEDFASDGKDGITPATSFYKDPPEGMGYLQPPVFQNSFLNPFVNSPQGKRRYNQPAGNHVVANEIRPTSTVGNLALRIYSDQNK